MPKSLFFPMLIKNMRQSLVQLAEVIPTSSGRSSYPPSALTRGRLAHFVHLRTSGSRHAPTLHCAISQPSWLHFVFPTLAQECYDKNKKKINFLFQLLKLSIETNGVPLLTVANTLPTSLFLTAFIAHKGCFPCSTFRL